MTCAPVVLFTYNRPVHARRTLESLALNPEAERTELFIYADGPKPEATAAERENVEQVRRVIRERAWCGRVTVIEAETNRGLAASITGGVRAVLAEAGSAIVLEDDLRVAPGFLHYMNAGLRCYESEPAVMHVSGYLPPVRASLPETFFLRLTSSWGWATWRRAFAHFEGDASSLLARLEQHELLEVLNLDGAHDYAAQLRANAAGRLRTWAVQWYASVLLQGGLGLFPRHSLVENTGFDGSGTHCRSDQGRAGGCSNERIEVRPLPPHENAAARRAVRATLLPPLRTRLREKVRRLFTKPPVTA